MIIDNKKLVFALAFVLSPALYAQDTTLGQAGQSELQQKTGDAVQRTCGGFVRNEGGLNPDGATPDNTPLWFTCRGMVQNANQLAGNGGGTGASFGMNADQLAASLQQIATEEFAATESIANEIATNRMDPVITRLSAIRAGVAGFSVTGFQPDADSELLADGAWYQQHESLRGGSAGDDGPGSALSGFANINYGFGNREGTDRTDEFDYTSYNVTVGLDYRFASNVVFGGALSYYNIESEFEETTTVAGGDTEVNGFGGFLYSTWYGENFYVDGLLGYSVSNYDLKRNIVIPWQTGQPSGAPAGPLSETAQAKPDGKDFSGSIGAGYTWNPGAASVGPYLRLTYIQADIDSYAEEGADASQLNLSVDSQDWKSLTSVLGASFSYAISSGSGIIVPQARLGWVHQFENDSSAINAVYVSDPRNNVLTAATDDPDRDYAELGLALSGVFKGGAQAFFSYDTLLGFERLTSHLFTLGGRIEF